MTAVIFALKTRHACRKGERVETGSTHVQSNIYLPSAMTPEAYPRMLGVTPSSAVE